MSIRRKVILIMIPITLVAIMLVNLVFGLFFLNYLKEQEKNQMGNDFNALLSYINSKKIVYMGKANDWGHWDDTYDFVNGQNSNYPTLNLGEDVFQNLDVNFLLFFNNSGPVYKTYYNFENKQYIEIQDAFLSDINKAFEPDRTRSDASGIYYIDGDFYFIASTDITDSIYEKPSAGKLIIGRRLDAAVIHNIEILLSVNIESINLRERVDGIKEVQGPSEVKLSENDDTIIFDCIVPARPGAAVFTLARPRELFISGRAKLYGFLIINAIAMLIILGAIFIVSGFYISAPIVRLIQDVSNIDTGNIQKLKVQGKHEFAFLEETINHLLENIESEQSKLRESEEKLYATLVSVGDGVMVVDKDNKIVFMNPAAEGLTGWQDSSALGHDFEGVFIIIDETNRKPMESPVKQAFELNTVTVMSNHTLLISKDHRELTIESSAAPIRNKKDETTGCVLVFRDFSERRQKQREIEYLSYHDQLTGLYNRRYFEEELKRIDSLDNLPISILYADVNGLKTLNDAFGHSCGDELVKKVAHAMKSECRHTDIVARTGGDEFVIILPQTERELVIPFVRRVRGLLKDIKINDIMVSISFGLASKSTGEQSIWMVLKDAEDDMYKKKIYNNASQRSNTIKSILNTLKLKSPREDAHSKRVSALCGAIAKAYGLGIYSISELKLAGELHDIGKIAVDEAVLNKAGPLNDEEWEQIKKHPETGFRLLSTSNEFYNLAEYVFAHHERWDGKGYPKGQKGDEINWQARVIAVADSFDAMTCHRPYKRALGRWKAITEIKKNAGTQFDPDIARVFIEKVLNEKWDDISC